MLNADDPVCVAYAPTHRRHACSGSAAARKVTPGRQPVRRQTGAGWQTAHGGGRNSHPRPPQCGERAGGLDRGRSRGRDTGAIAAAVRTFHAVEHRLEFVRKVKRNRFLQRFESHQRRRHAEGAGRLSGGLWVILGGKDKGLDYAAAARAAGGQGACGAADRRRRWQNREPVAGRGAAGGGEDAGRGHRLRLHARRAGRYGAAGARVRQLRPVQSFEHRGEVFKQIVNAIAGDKTDMAQRLKTDWILFVTVLVMMSFGI